MPRKKGSGQFDEFIGIPVGKELKKRIKKIADREERRPTEMTRLLIREAVERREGKHVAVVATA